jgi:Zn-dependent protease
MEQMREGLLFLIALILCISVHEFGHALVATRLGDQLPRAQGRLTLNPIRHADPIGTLLLPLIMVYTGAPLFGWGRPVQTNPLSYTRSISRSTGQMLVAIAGPAMNLVMAVVVSIGLVIAAKAHWLPVYVGEGQELSPVFLKIFYLFIRLNLVLMFFNLLPIPPLDGGAVLAWVLPRSLQNVVDFFNRWGFLILVGVVLIPGVLPTLMSPVAWLAGRWGALLVELVTP